MKNDYVVSIEYRTKNSDEVIKKSYELEQYTNMMKFELMRLIMDVEEAFSAANDDKPKNEWPSEIYNAFQKVRHKLLDQANAIERLPNNLYFKGDKI